MKTSEPAVETVTELSTTLPVAGPLPEHLPKTPGYHTKLAAVVGDKKCFEIVYKRTYKISTLPILAENWEQADAYAKKFAEKFGIRVISVRPHIFDIEEILSLKDLPTYL